MAKRRVSRASAGHNGGPPLDDPEHVPEWGRHGIGTYFDWRRARRTAWSRVGVATRIRRDDKAEALGLTYDEYTVEILERGRFLQAEDVERIAAIKGKRRARGSGGSIERG